VHPLPGDSRWWHLEALVVGAPPTENIRVHAQASREVLRWNSAEAEGMVTIEMMVEAAHHQQIANGAGKSFKLREIPAVFTVWAFSLRLRQWRRTNVCPYDRAPNDRELWR